jgi:hypothetical protein
VREEAVILIGDDCTGSWGSTLHSVLALAASRTALILPMGKRPIRMDARLNKESDVQPQ